MNMFMFYAQDNSWIAGELIDKKDILPLEEDQVPNHETFFMRKPVMLARVPTEDGRLGVQLVPFNVLDPEGDVEFANSFVVARPQGDLPESLFTEYVKATTNIQIARAH